MPATVLEQIPFRSEMIPKGDDRITPYLSDTLVRGDPDLVYRARDTKDLQQILGFCHLEKIPVTVSGSRTGLTGSGVAMNGLLIAMERRAKLLDIGIAKTGRPVATAEPGILLGDFQRQVAQAGYFYPPDPTSRDDAQLGGTIGTNATGEDSLLYGPTRKYVRRLKILRADGTEQVMERSRPYQGSTKNLAGYYLEGDPIDLLVGSEGTLGIVTEITVDLLPASPPFFLVWGFFPTLDAALEFVVAIRGSSDLRPRSMELMDRESLRIVARQERAPAAASHAGAAVTFKQEFHTEAEQEALMERWFKELEAILKTHRSLPLLNDIVVAEDEPAQTYLRRLRHAIPSTMNEEADRLVEKGGGKISTDWWVPVARIREMMKEVALEADPVIRTLVFGHIGDGHPHVNYLVKNGDELMRMKKIVERQCRKAVALGGGVAGEHGLGKLYRDHLKIQHPPSLIRKMREVKLQYDPHQILGRGTLWEN